MGKFLTGKSKKGLPKSTVKRALRESEDSQYSKDERARITKEDLLHSLHQRKAKFRILNATRKQLNQGKIVDQVTESSKNPKLHYKRPIEKLLTRVKKTIRDDIPADVSKHRQRHQTKRSYWFSSPAVRKQVDIVYEALKSQERPVQPRCGWKYNKRQRRLLLGRRHRALDDGWRYFDFLKSCLPRRIRPNDHLPDALFFVPNILLFLSLGIPSSFTGIKSVMFVLEDAKEYDAVLKDPSLLEDSDKLIGIDFWNEIAPLEKFSYLYFITKLLNVVFILLGFIGIYLADQSLHAVYFVGMLATFIYEFLVTLDVMEKEYCKPFLQEATRLMTLLVEKYYETILAHDMNGDSVMYLDPLTNSTTLAMIRTYRAANLMDRIQQSWQCCGVNGFEDYLMSNDTDDDSNSGVIPPTCCSPMWDLNPYCASSVKFDRSNPRFLQGIDGVVGCAPRLETFCKNSIKLMGPWMQNLLYAQFALFAVSCLGMLMQARQIRQLKREPYLRISAGTISQSLQTAPAGDAGKSGGGGALAVLEASKQAEKQAETIEKLKEMDPKSESSSSSSTSDSEGDKDAAVHTVDFQELQRLQKLVSEEEKARIGKQYVERAVEGFAGRFNIVANAHLQPYVTGIFSTTYQNETNAGLDAINAILDKQFATHTTDYNWRKLLKPKKGQAEPTATTSRINKITKYKR